MMHLLLLSYNSLTFKNIQFTNIYEKEKQNILILKEAGIRNWLELNSSQTNNACIIITVAFLKQSSLNYIILFMKRKICSQIYTSKP